ncbi:MAG: hypothetical protein AAFP70_07525 [Calditrichota bacterium]
MKKRIDWLNHLLEFSVVLIGILIAFQLNKCGDESRQQDLVETHLNNIMEETKYNVGNFQYAIYKAETGLKNIDSVLTLIKERGNSSEINRIALKLLDYGGIYIRKTAYTSLMESGDMRLIKDLDQRTSVINLYEYYRWVDLIERISSGSYNDDLKPYLKNNFNFTGGTVPKEDVYYSRQFTNVLITYRVTLESRVTRYKECMKIMKEYAESK